MIVHCAASLGVPNNNDGAVLGASWDPSVGSLHILQVCVHWGGGMGFSFN